MLEYKDEHINLKEKTLKDFIPLVITFFLGLVVLSIYQNTVLYSFGVLDSILNTSFFIYLLHHLGFASVCSLFLAFVFNILENRKYGLGLKVVQVLLLLLLLAEASLITYYVQNFEPLGADFVGLFKKSEIRFSVLQTLVVSLFTLAICYFCYRYIKSFYSVISRMYPLTIIFFSIFLATLYSDKKPVNENKIQHLAQHITKKLFQSQTYDGKEEFPLLNPFYNVAGLSQYFDLKDSMPHIKIIIVDGLGNDLVQGDFKAFMPQLQGLKEESLYWSNFLSNTGESYASFPNVVGSLPFGEAGFTQIPNFTYRNTLYSILKNNGYATSFNYGGNTALYNFDKFLEEEKVSLIFDRNNFGNEFKLQEEDAAGITLGYPDKALFSNYDKNVQFYTVPKFDVFVTLSTKAPFHIPNSSKYQEQVSQIVEQSNFEGATNRFIRRNDELFASFLYADEALNDFLTQERKHKTYLNTIYIITGSHQLAELPQANTLSKYRVPLIMYSPLLKKTGVIPKITSHADIAPSLISLLNEGYSFTKPNQMAWMGQDLVDKSDLKTYNEIPLLRNAYNIQDYIMNDLFYTDGKTFHLDHNLNLEEIDNESAIDPIEKRFENFKSVNNYVTKNNRIIPKSVSLIADKNPKFSKEEIIWIESVFNGKDFDDAYSKAKDMAFDKDYGRALLLCEYILSEIPRHADTEILMGRIYSWKENYDKSIALLNEVIEKYPKYEDGYCALMDAYFWSGQNEFAYDIQRTAKSNSVQDRILNEKFERSISLIVAQEKTTKALELKTAEVNTEQK
ncbi:sulfatase-like hydrolase/transferase [Maribacter sp. PR1]|uniref:Sulfatase-like hydrolase/transferase n=1 Tax=Maribacter cobaltidurans TaxID=1178778 RepID=A0ABU7ISG7_9FLAO|nr:MULTISPECIES: sulfatase-like hydrolase/transferase [Maribacter]MDC6388533.1 sulfatase-like hydrolase/transferase [Maribacter sp. PR1]MEE1975922.1 sulfatase-like hydrolase/transferase [Maribacter cobaltidurans]